METAKNVTAIVYYLLGIVSLVIARQKSVGAKASMTDSSTSAGASIGQRQSNKRLLAAVSVYLLLGAILTGAFWKQASDNKLKADSLQTQVDTLNNNAWKDMSISDLQLVENQTFRNEVVDLDGKRFLRCNFYYVTFHFEGKRPFALQYGNFYEPVTIKAPSSVDNIIVLLNSMGAINTNKVGVT